MELWNPNLVPRSHSVLHWPWEIWVRLEINGILELYFRFQSPGFRIPRAKIPGVWIPETKFPMKEKDKIFQHKKSNIETGFSFYSRFNF